VGCDGKASVTQVLLQQAGAAEVSSIHAACCPPGWGEGTSVLLMPEAGWGSASQGGISGAVHPWLLGLVGCAGEVLPLARGAPGLVCCACGPVGSGAAEASCSRWLQRLCLPSSPPWFTFSSCT